MRNKKNKKCVDEDNQPEENVIYFSVLLGNIKKKHINAESVNNLQWCFYFCFPTTNPVHYMCKPIILQQPFSFNYRNSAKNFVCGKCAVVIFGVASFTHF